MSTVMNHNPGDYRGLLQRLIIAGENAVALHRSARREDIGELAAEVVAAVARPEPDDERTVDDLTHLYAQALTLTDIELWRHDRGRAARYAAVVGVLLPDIRAALSRAMDVWMHRRPTP